MLNEKSGTLVYDYSLSPLQIGLFPWLSYHISMRVKTIMAKLTIVAEGAAYPICPFKLGVITKSIDSLCKPEFKQENIINRHEDVS